MVNTNYDEATIREVEELEARIKEAEGRNVGLSNSMMGMNTMQRDQNFLHQQISTDEILEKLEHFYRGDVQGEDNDGNIVWQENKNKEMITFNEFGVSSIMEIITKYIDKGTILSYYDSQRIYEIIGDIGDELVLLILCNYEKMGMNTPYKKTKFRMIIITTLHIIESTYRRALGGKTLEEVNQSRVVGQFNSPQIPMGSPQMQKRGFFEKVFRVR